MNSIINFYRWLSDRHDTNFEHSLFEQWESFVSYKDSMGFSHSKAVHSTDLSIRVPRSREDYTDYIQDGGKLRPLDKNEQESLMKALSSIGNIEMTLAFLLALSTGARIQTVFTLRVGHVLAKVKSDNELTLKVGLGTEIDTKNNKRMLLHIPPWLHEALKIYAKSDRARKRRELSTHKFGTKDSQYLFLTKSGKPYYIADRDPLKTSYRNPPKGGAIRQFISNVLKPELIKHGFSSEFSFHFLRATYGMNLLHSRLKNVDSKGSLTKILLFVRERMGHNQLATTERYLDYRKNIEIAKYCQKDFEDHMKALTQIDWESI